MSSMERTCVLLKPDALQRGLFGEIVHRFERKGLQIVGCKMIQISDPTIEEHYAQYREKPFFGRLKEFMQSAPVVALVLEGVDAIETARTLVGPTKGRTAPAGTIRGDFAMSLQSNLIHASDASATAEQEIARFFRPEEIFAYEKVDCCWVYAEEERK